MPTTRAGASSGGGNDSGIDESMSQAREARTLTQADIQTIIQAGIQAGIQVALAADRALRTEPSTPGDHNPGKINTSGMDQLPGDVSLRDFLTWRRKWNDFSKLEHLSRHTATDLIAALRMVMSPAILGTMDKFLSTNPQTDKTTDAVLDAIQNLLRSRRSFYVDREELHDCKLKPEYLLKGNCVRDISDFVFQNL